MTIEELTQQEKNKKIDGYRKQFIVGEVVGTSMRQNLVDYIEDCGLTHDQAERLVKEYDELPLIP